MRRFPLNMSGPEREAFVSLLLLADAGPQVRGICTVATFTRCVGRTVSRWA